jgi:hypothetical protein
MRNTLSCLHLYCGGVLIASGSRIISKLTGTRISTASLRRPYVVHVTRRSGSGSAEARRLTPLLSVFPLFAEGFSHLTLDVGVRLPGRLPIAANKRFG